MEFDTSINTIEDNKIILDVRNPKYNRFNTIDCEILHSKFGWTHFTASPNDNVDYGREVYQKIINGEFGEIAPYEVNIELESEMIKDQRNRLLEQSDWTQLPDVPQSLKDLWVPYRQALRDVPQQEGFPLNVVWPTPPNS